MGKPRGRQGTLLEVTTPTRATRQKRLRQSQLSRQTLSETQGKNHAKRAREEGIAYQEHLVYHNTNSHKQDTKAGE